MPHRYSRRRWPIKFTKAVLAAVLLGGVALTLGALVVFIAFARNLPNPSNLEDRTITESTKFTTAPARSFSTISTARNGAP